MDQGQGGWPGRPARRGCDRACASRVKAPGAALHHEDARDRSPVRGDLENRVPSADSGRRPGPDHTVSSMAGRRHRVDAGRRRARRSARWTTARGTARPRVTVAFSSPTMLDRPARSVIVRDSRDFGPHAPRLDRFRPEWCVTDASGVRASTDSQRSARPSYLSIASMKVSPSAAERSAS